MQRVSGASEAEERLEKQSKARGATESVETDSGDVPIIRAIEFPGATPEDSRKAMSAITSREGEPLSPVKQRQDIKKLYDLGIFQSDIAIQADNVPGGVKLRYIVRPNAKVSAINVSGNTQVKTSKILSELPVKAGETYTIQAQNKLRETVQKYYEEKGFTEAVIHVEERPTADGRVDLMIVVDEGTKMQIKDLVIRGNESVKDLPLKLRVNNKGSFGPFKKFYNESKFQQDLDSVKAAYLAKGYLDVDVRRGEFTYAEDRSWVSPAIDVTEGTRYRVGTVTGRGYTIFGHDEVMKAFEGFQGDYYNAPKFLSAADKVKNMYGDEGFLMCKVEPDFRKNPSTGVVDIDVDVNEGPRIYVGDVKIVSQTYPEDAEMGWLRRFYGRFSPPVRDEVIQREVRMKPGQVYRRFDEVRTKERLQSLNVFEEVRVTDELGADPCVRDCVVDVTQGNTGNLIFGVGFGDVEGAFVYANYIEHNLFGLARDLRVSTLLGSNAMNFGISYLDRYFLDRDLSAKFDLFHRTFDRVGEIEQTNTGLMAEFTCPIDDCLKKSLRLRLENISFDLDDDYDDDDDDDHHGENRRHDDDDDKPATDIDDYIAATVRFRLAHDTRDSMFFPTSGHILAGSVETGVADGFLLKFEGQYAKYFCVGSNWVLAVNNQLGIMPYDADDIGYADRFFLGGSQDMRGFELYGAGPHDKNVDELPLGGATKLLSQIEMRYPFTDNLTGVLFTDIGMLDESAFGIGSPRVSVGTGFRMRLPIASLAVDLGVPVVKEDEDQTQVLHFTMTSSF